MSKGSPKLRRVPDGAIEPSEIDNNPGKRRRLLKPIYLPSHKIVAAAMDLPETTVMSWFQGRTPMEVGHFYAMCRLLDIPAAKALLMAEELYVRRLRHQDHQREKAQQ